MPSLCTSAVSEQDKREVMYNYEVFAATIREHYAFMELNNINWDLLYEQKREELANAPTEVNLYRTLEETLDTLGDNHAYLEADEALYTSMELNATTEENTAEEQLPEYGDFQIANLVAEHHLVEDMTQASWLMKWGKLTDKLGYLAVKAMWLYADLEVPQTLIDEMGYVDAFVSTFQQMDEGTYVDQEVKGAARIMDRVMADLENTQAIVIDLRFNGGGQDAVSFEILRRFNPNREKIVTAKWKHKEGYSPVHVIHLPAEQAAYTKPIYILISPQTGSAAEAFAIASKALDHTKLVGSSSLGATSTSLEKKLPNGWSFAISNEVYMDTIGQNYENVGVPVVYDFDYPRDRQAFFRSVANDLEADKRDILRMINNLE
ncbi:MAG: S41 family peptidase [Bacteroidota bacterium]